MTLNPATSTTATLGPSLVYVTVQDTPPGSDFVSPLVEDTTSVSGGLYAWDGSAYQKVAGALS